MHKLYSVEQKEPSSFKYPHGLHRYINLPVNKLSLLDCSTTYHSKII